MGEYVFDPLKEPKKSQEAISCKPKTTAEETTSQGSTVPVGSFGIRPDYYKVLESFSWVPKDAFKIEDRSKDTVFVKGVALRSDIVSKNHRHYVDEEVLRSARTLRGTAFVVNHDQSRIIGHVEDSEYEDGALEYTAILKKNKPEVQMLLNKDPRVRGVSVDADYRINKCIRCGQEFADIEQFTKHMHEVEKVFNFNYEPHGIHFKGLSMVIEPEVPGIEGTSVIPITETEDGLNRLFEMVIKERGFGVRKESSISVSPTGPVSLPKPKLNMEKVKELGIDELRLGEPFAGYVNFEDCVSKNQDKENPEAFCATIKRKVEGEMTVSEAIKNLLNSPFKREFNLLSDMWDSVVLEWEGKIKKLSDELETEKRHNQNEAKETLDKISKLKTENEALTQTKAKQRKELDDWENRWDHLKPQFKAQTKGTTPSRTQEYVVDPLTKRS